MREDSFVSSTGPDQYSETAIFSGSDSEVQGPPTRSQDQDQDQDQAPTPQSALSESELLPTPPELPSSSSSPSSEAEKSHVNDPPSEKRFSASADLHLDINVLSSAREPVEEVPTAALRERAEPIQDGAATLVHQGTRRSTSILSRKISSDSLPVSVFTDKCCLA